MILSRNWLNEFVDLKDITDKEFNDEMTLSGSRPSSVPTRTSRTWSSAKFSR